LSRGKRLRQPLGDPLRSLALADEFPDTHRGALWSAAATFLRAEWSIESIDRNSGGFEHAAILTDLDGDGVDELYVANDDDGEINRYVWVDGTPQRELLYTHPEGLSGFTWNIMPCPISLIPPG
jgi:hypothetical protein